MKRRPWICKKTVRRAIWERFEGGKRMEKSCHYMIISIIKKNGGQTLLSKHNRLKCTAKMSLGSFHLGWAVEWRVFKFAWVWGSQSQVRSFWPRKEQFVHLQKLPLVTEPRLLSVGQHCWDICSHSCFLSSAFFSLHPFQGSLGGSLLPCVGRAGPVQLLEWVTAAPHCSPFSQQNIWFLFTPGSF